MVRRSGELTKSGIDRGWPHQVALRASECTGRVFDTIHAFITEEGLSHCPRNQGFYREGIWHTVHCFAERADADKFKARFGGELIDPKDRPRWPNAVKRRK